MMEEEKVSLAAPKKDETMQVHKSFFGLKWKSSLIA
jgi:hypothetical protein